MSRGWNVFEGGDNPADLYIKFMDSTTSDHHACKVEHKSVQGRPIETPQLHSMSRSVDDYHNGDDHEHCEWIKVLLGSIGYTTSRGRYRKRIGEINSVSNGRERKLEQCGCANTTNNELWTTDVWQQTFRGTNWQTQGSNGWNAVQLVQL